MCFLGADWAQGLAHSGCQRNVWAVTQSPQAPSPVSPHRLRDFFHRAALDEEDQRELRATRVVLASRALWESRGPEVRRAHLVPPALQA